MKLTKCCKAEATYSERIPEDNYPYGASEEVLICSQCGIERPDFI